MYVMKRIVVEARQWFKHGDHPAVTPRPKDHGADDSTGFIATRDGHFVVQPGDWIVTGVEGKHYPVKPSVFEKTYEPAFEDAQPISFQLNAKHQFFAATPPIEVRNPPDNSGLTFSEALRIVKKGGRVAREGWNGKGMFIFLVPGSTFTVNRPPLLGIYPEGTVINYHPHIDMRTATGEIVPWLASQTDLLAEDWEVLADAAVDGDAPPLSTAKAAAEGHEANPWPIDVSPEQTVRAVLRNCARPAKSKLTKTEPLWSIASKVTAHGSTYSFALCKWAGLDPDELVMRAR